MTQRRVMLCYGMVCYVMTWLVVRGGVMLSYSMLGYAACSMLSVRMKGHATVLRNNTDRRHYDVNATLHHSPVDFPCPQARATVSNSQTPMARSLSLSLFLS